MFGNEIVFDLKPVLCLCLLPLVLIGCATDQGPSPVSYPGPIQRAAQERPKPGPYFPPAPQSPDAQRRPYLVPPHMQGRPVVRLALLLPFSSSNEALRDQAQSMLDAAELAIFESGDPRLILIPKDTGGSYEGAAKAARSAIDQGADVLVGPLLSRAVVGAAQLATAEHIPLISFSTDHNVAGNGVYLMSFQPETEIARIVSYAVQQGHTNIALLHGQSAYGRRVATSLQRQMALHGSMVLDVESYPRNTREMDAPAARIAHTQERKKALRAWQAAGGIGDPALDPHFAFTLPYSAILLPESGIRLQSLAPLLPYHDVDPRKTRFLGTGLWFDESLTREPALNGGWFPGPDLDSMTGFRTSYMAAYTHEPKRLASLAYDAVRVAGAIVETSQNTKNFVRIDWLEDPRGFQGATGLFRFGHGGLVEHALAIYEMRRAGFKVIDPAPVQFDPPSL